MCVHFGGFSFITAYGCHGTTSIHCLCKLLGLWWHDYNITNVGLFLFFLLRSFRFSTLFRSSWRRLCILILIASLMKLIIGGFSTLWLIYYASAIKGFKWLHWGPLSLLISRLMIIWRYLVNVISSLIKWAHVFTNYSNFASAFYFYFFYVFLILNSYFFRSICFCLSFSIAIQSIR